MKNKFTITIAALIVLLLTSCTNKLVGTWNIEKYTTTIPEHEGVVLTNIGTMTFKADGLGDKQLNYTIMDVTINDNEPFTWISTDKYVTIKGGNTEFAKTWIMVENGAKSQKWNSTQDNVVQIIELKKQ